MGTMYGEGADLSPSPVPKYSCTTLNVRSRQPTDKEESAEKFFMVSVTPNFCCTHNDTLQRQHYRPQSQGHKINNRIFITFQFKKRETEKPNI